MRVRMIAVAGIATASLILYGLSSGAATASKSGHQSVSVNAASGGAHDSAHPTKLPKDINVNALCGTSFGAELPLVDGLISWNDAHDPQNGYDTSGAADFTCSVPTTIHKVWAYGFGGNRTDMFNVTFYYNDTTDSSNEPDDSDLLDGVACHFSNVVGAAGGDGINGHVLTKLKVGSCHLPAGKFWVAVQNNNPAGPWYWEMQVAQQGDAPDWRDVNNSFDTGCTTFDGNDTGSNGGDEYLLGCLGYDYGDYMFVLK